MTHQINNWRKSSASDNAANCVEAGWTPTRYVFRDTKQAAIGEGADRPTLEVSRAAAARFIAMARGDAS